MQTRFSSRLSGSRRLSAAGLGPRSWSRSPEGAGPFLHVMAASALAGDVTWQAQGLGLHFWVGSTFFPGVQTLARGWIRARGVGRYWAGSSSSHLHAGNGGLCSGQRQAGVKVAPCPPSACVVVVVVKMCLTLCNSMDRSTPGFPVLHHLREFVQTHITSTELMMPSNHFILCHPLLLLPSIFPSIRVLSNESALHISWLKYWSFSITPSNEYLVLTSFKMDLFDLLAVQGTLKSLFQHHNSEASIPWCSVFFMIQLSTSIHDYWENHVALTIWTFVNKVIFLLFNMLSSLVIAFLPRSKCLLISWLQSLSAWFWSPGK